MDFFSQISKGFKENGYLIIRSPVKKEDVSEAIDNFVNFLKLPDSFKNQLSPNLESNINYSESENKEYLSYSPGIKRNINSPEIDNFILSAEKIYAVAKTAMQEIIIQLEKQFPGIHKNFVPHHNVNPYHLVFMKYGKDLEKIPARPHYDKCALTLLLSETNPGLRIGINNKTTKPVMAAKNQAILMAGVRMRSITNQDFRPGWHEIAHDRKNNINENISRISIVFFADITEGPYPTFSEFTNSIEYSD